MAAAINSREQVRKAVCAQTEVTLGVLSRVTNMPVALRLKIEEAVETALELAFRVPSHEPAPSAQILRFPRRTDRAQHRNFAVHS
jgi:hypothetical protein